MKKHIEKLVIISMLTALSIVLSRFVSFSAYNMKISISFLPILICGYLYGPIYSCGVAGIADLIGALLFPIGVYFPGFTITAIFAGIVRGLFFNKKHNITNAKIFLMVLINQLIVGLLINTFFISYLYGTAYKVLIITRIPQYLIMIPVEFLLSKLLLKYFERRHIC